MRYAVEIPEEPGDLTVVTDCEGVAWQRHGDITDADITPWCAALVEAEGGTGTACSWLDLVTKNGPLTLLAPADGDVPDWQAAGFTGPDLERYAQPEGVERVDAPGLDDPPAGPDYGALTDDQRDDALATHGQAIDYRPYDQRVIGLKHAAGACASTWQLTDDPNGGVTSRELGRPGPGRVHVEFVGGPHCGERETVNVDPETMTAPESIARDHKVSNTQRTTVYLRRPQSSTNRNDGVSAWLYDAQRPEEPTS